MSANNHHAGPARVVVIGLGRFGSSLALELIERGTEILALDTRPQLVQQIVSDVAAAG